jgi:hypothetical protein
MKNIFLAAIALLFTSVVCFAQSEQFCYDGICFNHEKNWKISNTAVNGTTTIKCNRTKNKALMFVPYAGLPQGNYLTILKYKTDGLSNEEFLKTYADQMKTIYDKNSKTKVKSIGEITSRTINGIEAKSIDIDALYYQRTYRFTNSGYDIVMIISVGKAEHIEADFAEILNSFSFKPE